MASAARTQIMAAVMRTRPMPAGLLNANKFILPRQALRPSLERSAIQTAYRRAYATLPPPPTPTQKPPKRKFGFLRFLWRTTWVSGLLGLGYLSYSIYETRNPIEQVEPDPSKKTLVILGMSGITVGETESSPLRT